MQQKKVQNDYNDGNVVDFPNPYISESPRFKYQNSFSTHNKNRSVNNLFDPKNKNNINSLQSDTS